MERESAKDVQALFLLGFRLDDSQGLRGSIERVGTDERLEIRSWDELLLALQQLTGQDTPATVPVDAHAVTSVLERLAAWYAAQAPLDRLILSRLISGKLRSEVLPFGSGEEAALLEPDEIVQLGTLFTNADLGRIEALFRRDDI